LTFLRLRCIIRLFEYRIERVLGRGAFGTVYLAHDTLLDRAIAIKELTVTAQTDKVAFKRFLQKVRAAGVPFPDDTRDSDRWPCFRLSRRCPTGPIFGYQIQRPPGAVSFGLLGPAQ